MFQRTKIWYQGDWKKQSWQCTIYDPQFRFVGCVQFPYIQFCQSASQIIPEHILLNKKAVTKGGVHVEPLCRRCAQRHVVHPESSFETWTMWTVATDSGSKSYLALTWHLKPTETIQPTLNAWNFPTHEDWWMHSDASICNNKTSQQSIMGWQTTMPGWCFGILVSMLTQYWLHVDL